MSEKHQFAFYLEELSEYRKRQKSSNTIALKDKKLLHRIVRVLRLSENDSCILFDRTTHVIFTMNKIESGAITGTVSDWVDSTALKPHITVFVPLLLKGETDAVVYQLTMFGVTTIQLIITDKTKRSWGGAREYERLSRTMIAAAEQSKNFALPTLKEPVYIESMSNNDALRDDYFICFHQDGKPLATVIQHTDHTTHNRIAIIVGPSGDFTDQEKKMLRDMSATFCKLTPTILRSQDAIALGVGIVRSWYSF